MFELGKASAAPRLIGALSLGVVALVLRQFPLQLLGDGTPEFWLGGGLVLMSFVLYGEGGGLLTALVSVVSFLARGGAEGLAMLVHVAEAWAVYRIHRRYGSLVFSAAAFWLTAGWLMDGIVYGWWLGHEPGYLGLLLLKHGFNSVLGALGAELLLVAAGTGPLASPRPPAPGIALRSYFQNRTMFLVAAPALALGIVHTRATYQAGVDALQRQQDDQAPGQAAQRPGVLHAPLAAALGPAAVGHADQQPVVQVVAQVGGQGGHAAVAVLGMGRQALREEVGEAHAHCRVPTAQLGSGVRRGRRRAAQGLVQHQAERIDVGRRADRLDQLSPRADGVDGGALEGEVGVEEMLKHMDYIINLIGIEHMALGMDFVKYDGPRTLKDRHHPLHKDPLIKGFEEIEDLPNLIDGLQRHGYKDEEIKMVLGGNYLRVLKTILPEQSVI